MIVGFIVMVAELDFPPWVAVIVDVSAASTYGVVMVNDVFVAPAGTVTVPGTPTAVRLELSVNVDPPAGATVGNVIVPVLLVPPTTSVGFTDRANAPGALIVRVAVAVLAPSVAAILAVVVEVTADVVIGKLTELAPAGTSTEPTTDAAALFDESVTVVPPVGAMPVRVTVPVDPLPPKTEVGDRLIPSRPGALTVRDVVLVTFP